jgi:glycosyltransferase involved in cell wall biosynthesis
MVVDNAYPDVRVEREANALLERGYEVDVICAGLPGQPRRERRGRLTVYRLPVRRRRGASPIAQLWEYLAFLCMATAMVAMQHLKARYDVVQAHNVPDFLVFTAALPKLMGSGVILDLHDLMPEFYASRFGGRMDSLLVRLVRLQERAAASFADRVITVTEAWRATLVDRGIAPRKVTVVMNLPDDRIFRPREPMIRESEPLTVIYHGTFAYRSGLDVLIRALQRARQRAALRLLLHGRGEYLEEAQRLVERLDLGDAVEFSTRSLPTDELPNLLSRADIGVVPYRRDIFTDGIFPTKLMEYAVLGIPSIVSRSSAVEAYFTPDMVRFVEPGDVEDLADALCELASDADLRRRLATNALDLAKHRVWRDQADTYVSLVDELNDRKTKAANVLRT